MTLAVDTDDSGCRESGKKGAAGVDLRLRPRIRMRIVRSTRGFHLPTCEFLYSEGSTLKTVT